MATPTRAAKPPETGEEDELLDYFTDNEEEDIFDDVEDDSSKQCPCGNILKSCPNCSMNNLLNFQLKKKNEGGHFYDIPPQH